jgi:hypothetical protein
MRIFYPFFLFLLWPLALVAAELSDDTVNALLVLLNKQPISEFELTSERVDALSDVSGTGITPVDGASYEARLNYAPGIDTFLVSPLVFDETGQFTFTAPAGRFGNTGLASGSIGLEVVEIIGDAERSLGEAELFVVVPTYNGPEGVVSLLALEFRVAMLDDVIRSYTALNEQSPSTAFASAAADAESLLEFVEDTRATIGQLLADYDTDADAAAALDTMDGIAFQQLGVYAPEYTGSYDFTQFEAISIAPGSPGESYSAELVFAEDAPSDGGGEGGSPDPQPRTAQQSRTAEELEAALQAYKQGTYDEVFTDTRNTIQDITSSVRTAALVTASAALYTGNLPAAAGAVVIAGATKVIDAQIDSIAIVALTASKAIEDGQVTFDSLREPLSIWGSQVVGNLVGAIGGLPGEIQEKWDKVSDFLGGKLESFGSTVVNGAFSAYDNLPKLTEVFSLSQSQDERLDALLAQVFYDEGGALPPDGTEPNSPFDPGYVDPATVLPPEGTNWTGCLSLFTQPTDLGGFCADGPVVEHRVLNSCTVAVGVGVKVTTGGYAGGSPNLQPGESFVTAYGGCARNDLIPVGCSPSRLTDCN